MKLSMAQISMSENIDENRAKALEYCEKANGSDLLFFPEIQFSPFFPQHEKRDAGRFLMDLEEGTIAKMQEIAKKQGMFLSPNLYLSLGGKSYDASLWIDRDGRLVDIAKMVNISQAPFFYEQDYYTPSDDGYKVFDTDFGKVGIVICYDRHFPESVEICAGMGARLVIIPTANCKAEPMDKFEQEVRDLAKQNHVFAAMCNRVGKEDEMDFAGESLVVDPEGNVLLKGDDTEQLLTIELPLGK